MEIIDVFLKLTSYPNMTFCRENYLRISNLYGELAEILFDVSCGEKYPSRLTAKVSQKEDSLK